MKLWIVTRNDDRAGYSDYLGFVCAAETEDDARNIHPSGDDSMFDGKEFLIDKKPHFEPNNWVERDRVGDLSVRMIGYAADGITKGVLFTDQLGD